VTETTYKWDHKQAIHKHIMQHAFPSNPVPTCTTEWTANILHKDEFWAAAHALCSYMSKAVTVLWRSLAKWTAYTIKPGFQPYACNARFTHATQNKENCLHKILHNARNARSKTGLTRKRKHVLSWCKQCKKWPIDGIAGICHMIQDGNGKCEFI